MRRGFSLLSLRDSTSMMFKKRLLTGRERSEWGSLLQKGWMLTQRGAGVSLGSGDSLS